MSGPVTPNDVPTLDPDGAPSPVGTVEVLAGREATVGDVAVRRLLPRRAHRTVGAWCFADHMGPAPVTEDHGIDIGPHPHIGLQTVTWLLEGEVLHRDSLGTEQVVRAGELNLMTAGDGVAHSEEATGRYRGPLHGIQLWVAQPDPSRRGRPAFEHHADLPEVELDRHGATAIVFVGALAGATSPARRDSDHLGAEIALPSTETAVVPVDRRHEHGVVVLDGAARVEGATVEPGRLAYLAPGRTEITLEAAGGPARLILLGGLPFDEELVMWWNFVARSTAEVDAARASWELDDSRFGQVRSPLDRIPAPVPGWMRR